MANSIFQFAKVVYRYFITDNVPASGDHEPIKSEIWSLFGLIDGAISSIALGGTVTIAVETLADLNALVEPDDTIAIVYADNNTDNNGFYVSDGGIWTQIPFTLPSTVLTQISDMAARIYVLQSDVAILQTETAENAAAIAAEVTARDTMDKRIVSEAPVIIRPGEQWV